VNRPGLCCLTVSDKEKGVVRLTPGSPAGRTGRGPGGIGRTSRGRVSRLEIKQNSFHQQPRLTRLTVLESAV